MAGVQVDYVEFPTDVIKTITFPQSGGDTSCGGLVPAPPFCNTYGYAKNGGGDPSGGGGDSGNPPMPPLACHGARWCLIAPEPFPMWGCVPYPIECPLGEQPPPIPGIDPDPDLPLAFAAATPRSTNFSPAPLVGGFTMSGVNGNPIPGIPGVGDEGQLRSYFTGSGGTAPENQDAYFVFLDEQQITFTTPYLAQLAGSAEGLTWGVDMALGGTVRYLPGEGQ